MPGKSRVRAAVRYSRFHPRCLLACALTLIALAGCDREPAVDADDDSPVTLTLVTDWRAQAEHGGFYQAQARGFYDDAGLNVRLRQGGPGVNVGQLVAAGAVELGLGSNAFIAMNLAAQDAPVRAVMAVFQKDPQVIITHPRDDVAGLEDLRGEPIMLSDAAIGAFWQWLKARFGYEDAQIRRYTFNLAPFLDNPRAVQQGYVTSEPYMIERALGAAPQVFLLADEGYPGYAAMVLANERILERHPDAVRAFVAATARGWYDYLHGDPSPGNALILRDNPEMSSDVLEQAHARLHEYAIVETPDTRRDGIGTMRESRWQEFHAVMSAQGLYAPAMDWRRAFTLDFLPAPDVRAGAEADRSAGDDPASPTSPSPRE